MGDADNWPTEADYAWAGEWQEGFCLALVEGLSPEAVLARMVLSPPTAVLRMAEAEEWASAQPETDYGMAVGARAVGGWTIALELNGFLATLPHGARRLSEGTRTAVVYRNVNALMSFLWAVDGAVIRSFDPLLYSNTGLGLGQALPEEDGLPFGISAAVGSAMACAERLTEVALSQGWLDSREDWIAVGHHPSSNSP